MRVRDERLSWAEDHLQQCRKIALRYFGTRLRVEAKADQSPVTIADRTIEEYLRRELGRAFPGDAIIGEEFGPPAEWSGDEAGSSAKSPTSYWTIDPIDGTRAFSRGLPSWGILLAHVQRNQPTLAACEFPMFQTFLGVGPGQVAYERRGEGRRLPLAKAAKPPALSRTVIFHGGSGWWLKGPHATGFTKLVRQCFLERAYGDCYAFLWAFRGNADAVIDCGVKIWDLAPFAALARATGRVLVDFSNRPSFTGPEAILAHPVLARQIAAILNENKKVRSP